MDSRWKVDRQAYAWGVLLVASMALPALARADSYEMHSSSNDRGSHTAYVLIRNGSSSASGSGDMSDFGDARGWRSRFHGDYLWFRIGEETWVTQDAGLLHRAEDA